ncbi:MAG: Do family serine endopeptidase [Bacteroidales bacterium]|nr:Do family serine endopeptidase [Bacteroidales bacterium]
MKRGFLTVLLSVLAGGITAYAVVKATQPEPTTPGAVTTDENGKAVEYRTVNLAETDYPDFTYAAESAVEAVVYVEVTVQRRQQYQNIDPFFRFFFGDEYAMPQQREAKGSGSGVIIRPDGYIVTNNHVVDGATKIQVTLNNNQQYDATVIGTDPATDVAIIKVDAAGLPTIPLGDSDKLRLGEWVLAIGSPLGVQLRSTITAGIVSAKGRSMPDDSGEFKIESFIQTDAAVNPGNSGGALVNKKGELVGINTAIVSQTGSYSGYSFAVPVNIVKRVVDDLIDFGSVKRAVLGISMGTVDKKIADEMKLSSVSGVYINEVSKGSAADKAGLRKDDVIIAIDGQKITDASSVQAKVAGYHPGDSADIAYIRDGKTAHVTVVFQAAAATNGEVALDGTTEFYGAKLRAADSETLKALNLKSGVEIVSLGSGKMADAGARAGSIIVYVNDKPVSKPEEVVAQAKKAARAVYIEGVDRNGRAFYFGFGK